MGHHLVQSSFQYKIWRKASFSSVLEAPLISATLELRFVVPCAEPRCLSIIFMMISKKKLEMIELRTRAGTVLSLEILPSERFFFVIIIIIVFITIIIINTRSYAALRAADLDWIVGPRYSLGRVHSGEKP